MCLLRSLPVRDGVHLSLKATLGGLRAIGIRAVGGEGTVVHGSELAEWEIDDAEDNTGLVRVHLRDPTLSSMKVLAASVKAAGRRLSTPTKEIIKLESEISYDGSPRLLEALDVERAIRSTMWSGEKPKYNHFTMSGAGREQVDLFIEGSTLGDHSLWKTVKWAHDDLSDNLSGLLSKVSPSDVVVPPLLIYVVDKVIQNVDDVCFCGIGAAYVGELIFRVPDMATYEPLCMAVHDAFARFVREQTWRFTVADDNISIVATSIQSRDEGTFLIPFEIEALWEEEDRHESDGSPGPDLEMIDVDDAGPTLIDTVLPAHSPSLPFFRNWVATSLAEIDSSRGRDRPPFVTTPTMSQFRKYRSVVVDRIVILCIKFHEIALGYFVPTGSDIKCSDQVRQNAIVLDGGKWFPRRLAYPSIIKMPHLSDRARAKLFIESTSNPNIYLETDVTAIKTIEIFQELMRRVNAIVMEQTEEDIMDAVTTIDSGVVICHEVQDNSDFFGSVVAKLVGSDTGVVQFSLSETNRTADMKFRPPIQRFTFSLRSYPYVLSLTEDGGISATTSNLIKADGMSRGHRSFELTPDYVQGIIDECKEIETENEQFIEEGAPLPLDNPDWTHKVFRRLWDLLEDRAPVFASFFGTQYHASQEDLTSAFFPGEHQLTDSECLLAIYNIGAWSVLLGATCLERRSSHALMPLAGVPLG